MADSEINLQYQVSTGNWTDCGDRSEEFLLRCESQNGPDEQGKIVPRFRATRNLNREEVVMALQAGQILRNHAEDWYSNCRSGAVVERRLAEKRAKQKPVEMVQCDCGHTVAGHLVMRASLGTACPDCYDDMS